MKITYSTVLVLEALARGYRYGFDILDATNLPSGTVYPILRRFENEGLVTSEWEAQGTATRDQRPPRRNHALQGSAGFERLEQFPAARRLGVADDTESRVPLFVRCYHAGPNGEWLEPKLRRVLRHCFGSGAPG